MKNINNSFCFKKKILNIYNQGILVCFQSFLSFAELQNKVGDHKTNSYLFNINNFWNVYYPFFYCSNINSYALYLRHPKSMKMLESLLEVTDLNVFYIVKNNRFYNFLYFQRLMKEENKFLSILSSNFYIQFFLLIMQLKRGFFFFMEILKNNKY